MPDALPSHAVRSAARIGKLTSVTPGLAPTYLQANLLVLPSHYAADFRTLCQRNPVPCPLLAESAHPGSHDTFHSHIPGISSAQLFTSSIDIRTDLPAYTLYSAGKLTRTALPNLTPHWTPDHVAFLIGCSFSFEAALCAASLPPPHLALAQNVAMYRTTIPLLPAGVFTGATMIVSMRPYKRREVARVREVTAAFGATHGEPVAWDWEGAAAIGVVDVDAPEWGDVARGRGGKTLGQERRERLEMPNGGGLDPEELVPVFWGCGVTPQEAVMRAGEKIEGCVMGHVPGHMLVMDVTDEQIKR